ncbi:MAG: hypothetical protein R2745_20845 [Vicinamibacterales bacterium]
MPPPTPDRPPGTLLTLTLLWCLAGGVAAYWLAAWRGLGVSTASPYLAVASVFPPADTAMAATAALSAELLRRGRPAAVLSGLLTAGALAFLGITDIAINLRFDVYREARGARLAWELWVNAFSLWFPVWLAVFCWRHRRGLGA